MQEKLIEIFKKAKYEPSPSLVAVVWSGIIARDERIARIKLWLYTSVGFISLAGLIPAFKMLTNDLSQSGFYEYFSLIFSDGGSILAYWKEFVFSLLESLPMVSIIFTFSLLFICFLSLRHLVKQIGRSMRFSGSQLLT
jgi:hypothetical protein